MGDENSKICPVPTGYRPYSYDVRTIGGETQTTCIAVSENAPPIVTYSFVNFVNSDPNNKGVQSNRVETLSVAHPFFRPQPITGDFGKIHALVFPEGATLDQEKRFREIVDYAKTHKVSAAVLKPLFVEAEKKPSFQSFSSVARLGAFANAVFVSAISKEPKLTPELLREKFGFGKQVFPRASLEDAQQFLQVMSLCHQRKIDFRDLCVSFAGFIEKSRDVSATDVVAQMNALAVVTFFLVLKSGAYENFYSQPNSFGPKNSEFVNAVLDRMQTASFKVTVSSKASTAFLYDLKADQLMCQSRYSPGEIPKDGALVLSLGKAILDSPGSSLTRGVDWTAAEIRDVQRGGFFICNAHQLHKKTEEQLDKSLRITPGQSPNPEQLVVKLAYYRMRNETKKADELYEQLLSFYYSSSKPIPGGGTAL